MVNFKKKMLIHRSKCKTLGNNGEHQRKCFFNEIRDDEDYNLNVFLHFKKLDNSHLLLVSLQSQF